MPSPRVLILEADVFTAAALRRQLLLLHSPAECMILHRVDEARAVLARSEVHLLITGIGVPGGDVLDLLLACADRPGSAPQTLVVTRDHQPRLLATLRAIAVNGVFDSTAEPEDKLVEIVQRIEAGGCYWSESLCAHLHSSCTRTFLNQLTPTEHFALAVIGDGCGDKVGAARLRMTLSATRALRRDLHAKLGVHDRSDLVRCAIKHGFVRSTSDGIVPFGLAFLAREYDAHRKRPKSTAPAFGPLGSRAAEMSPAA